MLYNVTHCDKRSNMPRISIKKKDYKKTDLTGYIMREMYVQNISQIEMATHLGITQPTLSYRFKHNSFSYGDLLTIFQVLGTPDEVIVKLMKL